MIQAATAERALGLGGLLLWGLGALLGDVLSVARSGDVDADGVHDDAIEDGGGDDGVAEVLAPFAQLDIGGDGDGGVGVSAIDEVVQGVGGSRFVVAFPQVAQTDIIDDQKLRPGPGSEAPGIGAVGKSCVEVIEEIDATGIAHGEALLAGTQPEGFEDVTLSSTWFASDDDVFFAPDEVESGEFQDGALVERRLKGPVEGL